MTLLELSCAAIRNGRVRNRNLVGKNSQQRRPADQQHEFSRSKRPLLPAFFVHIRANSWAVFSFLRNQDQTSAAYPPGLAGCAVVLPTGSRPWLLSPLIRFPMLSMVLRSGPLDAGAAALWITRPERRRRLWTIRHFPLPARPCRVLYRRRRRLARMSRLDHGLLPLSP
jgi:hypothetical protein